MKKESALKTIFVISIAGILFSGYLSYLELFRRTCLMGNSCTSIASIPVCVYGFFMYLIILIVSLMGLSQQK